ncbi:uncharacterized protein LOC113201837 [Frankliniella occidentalis]|uniref:Uncharacterized protein LOC113201837 n=1 Tax=Frankliniella occidentalis TaxID=133901 RepID=A0A9C6X0Y2_FRAOC|nr:uncharacterized protein LOC113201837 [Frankliniella occidentalis]
MINLYEYVAPAAKAPAKKDLVTKLSDLTKLLTDVPNEKLNSTSAKLDYLMPYTQSKINILSNKSDTTPLPTDVLQKGKASNSSTNVLTIPKPIPKGKENKERRTIVL